MPPAREPAKPLPRSQLVVRARSSSTARSLLFSSPRAFTPLPGASCRHIRRSSLWIYEAIDRCLTPANPQGCELATRSAEGCVLLQPARPTRGRRRPRPRGRRSRARPDIARYRAELVFQRAIEAAIPCQRQRSSLLSPTFQTSSRSAWPSHQAKQRLWSRARDSRGDRPLPDFARIHKAASSPRALLTAAFSSGPLDLLEDADARAHVGADRELDALARRTVLSYFRTFPQPARARRHSTTTERAYTTSSWPSITSRRPWM
jgi:hypothetical protein